MICPICRKDSRTANQIICADCKEKNPYNLLGGYSSTKSISEELKKVGPYEEQIKKQKKILRGALAAIVVLFLGLILSLVLRGGNQLPITNDMSVLTEKLEEQIMGLEEQLSKKKRELLIATENKAPIISEKNSVDESVNRMLEGQVSQYEAELKSLKQANLNKDQEIEDLKAEVAELNAQGVNVAAPSNAPSAIHIVSSGESLFSIALKYYKSENKMSLILEDNDISNPNKIYIGQKLKIRK